VASSSLVLSAKLIVIFAGKEGLKVEDFNDDSLGRGLIGSMNMELPNLFTGRL
jgi:hypothetical protein